MQEVSEMLKDVNGCFAVHIFCRIFAAMKQRILITMLAAVLLSCCTQEPRPTRRQMMMMRSYLGQMADYLQSERNYILAGNEGLKDTIDTYAIDTDMRNIDSLVSVLDSCIDF